MLIKNCYIIYKDRIEAGSVKIEAGKIKEINPREAEEDEIFDAQGLYLSPGFIDVHIHGACGRDVMEGTPEALNTISKAIVKHGTTSFLPTTMTMPIPEIHKALQNVKKLKEEGSQGAQILGAHLEGPFVSPKAIGAQNPKYLHLPDIEIYRQMAAGCFDAVVSMTLAPELEGAEQLVTYLSERGVICSAGHTMATYEQLQQAIAWGLKHSTHLYNAMSGFTHRQPGTVGAIFDSELTTETISDGIHSSYAALRIAYKQKGTDKVILVSDAMMACCMPDGEYALGGQKVIVSDGAARMENGVLAGSVLTLDKAVYNVYSKCNIPLHEAVKMATYNPALLCKAETFKGLIETGYDADLLLFDDEIKIKKVWIKGREIYSNM